LGCIPGLKHVPENKKEKWVFRFFFSKFQRPRPHAADPLEVLGAWMFADF